MTAKRQLAVVDLGAESGRVFLASYDGTNLTLQEMHRFANRPVPILSHLYWNIPSLWQEILAGLRRAREVAGELHSIGVDSWGVDYGLSDVSGQLLGLPFHYRDRRTDGIMEQVFARVPRETLYARTGIQFLPFNTLYQLVSHQQSQPRLLAYADRLLMIPDLFHCWLSGERVNEYTNATTTQCWSVPQKRWATELLETLGLPTHLLPPVVEPGTVVGPLLPALAQEFGAEVRVIVPATHDTGSAVAAIPAGDAPGWAYISSGTWSLVGLELPAPLIKPELTDAFTNEGGIFSTVRYLRNVMGLWLVQECRNTWARAGEVYSYDELGKLSQQASAFGPLIHPDQPVFLPPGDMPARIRLHLAERGQVLPETPGALVRCILESLVLRYRQVLEMIAVAGGTPLHTIHVVGGGAQHTQLNQWLANATGLPVLAGPVESSALGNALLQLVGLGELHTLAEVRSLSRAVTQTRQFLPEPDERADWDEAYQRFQEDR
ncbi:MAG TPA: rhamnulokinase family protein [Ktedonobacteraceae bacterium]|nr:rhamnulokinase family protein [Ktedonobacteraceae bacterium]